MGTPTAPGGEAPPKALEPDGDLGDVTAAGRPTGHREAGPPSARASLARSFAHAGHGLLYAARTQRNVRIHLGLAACALAMGGVLRLSAQEFALLFLAISSVLAAELFNTAAEAVVDLVTSEHQDLARAAKDVAAGAVLLSAVFAAGIGVLVFGPHLWPLFAR